MNKKDFLDKLNRKLDILNEKERKDIIDEYSDHIDEKIKNGLTEEEAIKDFGDIDELVKDILEAYNINTKYSNNKGSIENTISGFFDSLVKGISDIVNQIIDKFKGSDSNFNVDSFIKIVFELLIILVLIWVLKIPVYLIKEIGSGILGIFSSPFDNILNFAWRGFIELSYLVLALFVIVAIVKNRYINNSNNDKKNESKENIKKKKENSKKDDKSLNNNEKDKNDEMLKKASSKEIKRDDSKDILGNVLLIILKVFIVFFSLPFLGVLIGLCITLGLLVGLMFQNVFYFGFLILNLGLIFLTVSVLQLIYKFVLFDKRRKSGFLFSFITGFVFLGFGIVMTIHDVMSLEYVNTLPSAHYKMSENVFEYDMDHNTKIYLDDYGLKDAQIIYDNDLNNKVRIEASYYNDVVNLDFTNRHNIYLDIERSSNFKSSKSLYKVALNGLKNKKIYSYEKLFNPEVIIYINENYKDNIIYDY